MYSFSSLKDEDVKKTIYDRISVGLLIKVYILGVHFEGFTGKKNNWNFQRKGGKNDFLTINHIINIWYSTYNFNSPKIPFYSFMLFPTKIKQYFCFGNNNIISL